MNNHPIHIANIDQKSQQRGVGRYVQALKMVVDSQTRDKRIVINPFMNLSGAEFPKNTIRSNSQNIAVVHDVIPLKYPDKFKTGLLGKIKQKLCLSNLFKYQQIVTDSEVSKKDIATLTQIPNERIRVIYPYSPIFESSGQKSRPKNLPVSVIKMGYVLYVGDVNWHKNITKMAQACIESNTPLVCVGKAFEGIRGVIPNNIELDELRSFQKITSSNPDKISILGYVADEELVWLYENALANLLVSHDEGFGYSYVEAGYFGTPSILSDIPIFREISSSKGAIFVDGNSEKNISNAIIQLKNSPELRNNLSRESQSQTSKYSAGKFAQDWQDLF